MLHCHHFIFSPEECHWFIKRFQMVFSNAESLLPAQTFTQAIFGMLRGQKGKDTAMLVTAFHASLIMGLTCSRHNAAAVNTRADSFQSLTLICLAVDRWDRKVNSLIAALSSGDKLCTRDVGIYCSSQPTISTCLFWLWNGSSCQRRSGENRELIPANVAYAAVRERPSREYGSEPNPPPVAVWNASCFISLIN